MNVSTKTWERLVTGSVEIARAFSPAYFDPVTRAFYVFGGAISTGSGIHV